MLNYAEKVPASHLKTHWFRDFFHQSSIQCGQKLFEHIWHS